MESVAEQKIRVLVAKPGLDGHDRGAKVIARALRDAGMEVIYTGLRQTPEMIVNAALQEDVHVIGLSILSGAHNAIVPRVMDLLKQNKMDDVLVVVGGIIPDQDMEKLKEIGVAAIFQPGTAMDDIVQFIRANVKPRGVPVPVVLNVRESQLRLAMKSYGTTVGPSPWYWKTFPSVHRIRPALCMDPPRRPGPMAYLVIVKPLNGPENRVLALNTYCRPFLVPPSHLGVWCPEGRNIRLACFDPDQLKAFDFAEIAGWFKQSSRSHLLGDPACCRFRISHWLRAGMHKIEVPAELAGGRTDRSCQLSGQKQRRSGFCAVCVLSARRIGGSLTAEMVYRQPVSSGKAMDHASSARSESQRIFGECFGAGSFLLEEDGCRLERWIEKTWLEED